MSPAAVHGLVAESDLMCGVRIVTCPDTYRREVERLRAELGRASEDGGKTGRLSAEVATLREELASR